MIRKRTAWEYYQDGLTTHNGDDELITITAGIDQSVKDIPLEHEVYHTQDGVKNQQIDEEGGLIDGAIEDAAIDIKTIDQTVQGLESAIIVMDSIIDDGRPIAVESLILLDALKHQHVKHINSVVSDEFAKISPIGVESHSDKMSAIKNLRKQYVTEQNRLVKLGKDILGYIVKMITNLINWIKNKIDVNGRRLNSIEEKFKALKEDAFNNEDTFPSPAMDYALLIDPTTGKRMGVGEFINAVANVSHHLHKAGDIFIKDASIADKLVANIHDKYRGEGNVSSERQSEEFKKELEKLNEGKTKMAKMMFTLFKPKGGKAFCGIELSGYDASNLEVNDVDKSKITPGEYAAPSSVSFCLQLISDMKTANEQIKKARMLLGDINQKIITVNTMMTKSVDKGIFTADEVKRVREMIVNNLRIHKTLIRAALNGVSIVILYLNMSYDVGTKTNTSTESDKG